MAVAERDAFELSYLQLPGLRCFLNFCSQELDRMLFAADICSPAGGTIKL